jgi:Fe-S oxidoreductase
MISNGLLREAQALAQRNIRRLQQVADEGIPIVGLEPSCTVTLKDEYPDLARGDAAESVAHQTLMIEEYLIRLHEHGIRLPFKGRTRMVLLHGHCHQKAMVGTQPSLTALQWLPGAIVREVDSGCCGMAGSFGYEAEHYEVSLAMGERALFKAVRDLPPDALVVAAGVSCRQQIFHGTGRRALHLVEALAGALDGSGAE